MVAAKSLGRRAYQYAARLSSTCTYQNPFRCHTSTFVSDDQDSPSSLKTTLETDVQPSLPLSQLCKNILTSNWRGQLSTIKANSDKRDKDSLHASISDYVMLDGKPIVWLPNNDSHLVNLLMDDRGSLLAGHLDPPPLIATFRSLGKVLPRVILFGDFVSIDKTEVGYIKGRIAKQAEASRVQVQRAASDLQEILDRSGQLGIAQLNRLEWMSSPDNDYTPFRLYTRSCQYVDLAGGRHSVPVSDVVGAAMDPLAIFHAALVEGVNQSDDRRRALKLFCAAHLQLHVTDAYLFSADRWGFNILASPKSEENSQWREIRFTFSREVRSAESFLILLTEMEKEVLSVM